MLGVLIHTWLNLLDGSGKVFTTLLLNDRAKDCHSCCAKKSHIARGDLEIESLNGSIAHWGASASGTIGASADLSNNIHDLVFADTMRTLGLVFQEAKRRFGLSRTDPLAVKHILQYGLIGDPATRLALPTQPDFRVSASQITVTPIAPIPADSQLTVAVQLQNLGLVPRDSLTVQLTHIAPGGGSTVFTRRIPPFPLTLSLPFEVRIDEGNVGDNRFLVAVDPLNAYVEEDELNNTAEQTQIVFSTGLSLVSPLQFGLVPTQAPTLRVSLAGATEANTPVVFQLDRLPDFNSPDLAEYRTTTTQLAATWQPSGLQDGLTYYWRARIEDPEEPENWREGVFTIRTDLSAEGWIQQGALFEANQQNPFLERSPDGWRFRTFTVDASASAERGSGTFVGQFVINGEGFEGLGLGFGLVVIDGATGAIKGHGSMPTYPNTFEDPADAYAELQTLAALAQPGDFIMTRTRHLGNTSGATEIPDSVKAVFRTLGSTAIDTLTYQHLWIMFNRVGTPGTVVEFVEAPGSGINEIKEETSLPFAFGEGVTLSTPIGPAKSWQSFDWSQVLDNEDSNIRVEVMAQDGKTVLFGPYADPGAQDLSTLNARLSPFIRLRATLADSSRRSTPQLTSWHVVYEGVAELALDPSAFTFSADTLQEAQPLDITVVVRNFSNAAADTVVVDYLLTDPGNQTTFIHADTLFNVTAEGTSSYTLETRNLVGSSRLQVTVRQPGLQEETTFNNVLIRPFLVLKDGIDPTFSVLIDGEAFPNDPNPVINLQDPSLPFVSIRPVVEITIEDENPFFALKGDTTIISVTLDDDPVPFELLETVGKRKAGDSVRLRFEPDFTGRDSTHTLMVSVQDASGNEAQNSPYQVHFRTQSDVHVENVYPYPNPMNTFTVFAFRLLGAEAGQVEDLRLRIYTLSGLLIREFDLIEDPFATEAGHLRIGWNKVRWDGRDADGDLVATGVYLYKVFARAEGQSLPINGSKGIEKVVVIR